MSTFLKRDSPPPSFGHPLNEGDNILENCYGMDKERFENVPLSEGVSEGRGRRSGEVPKPLPKYRRLYNPNLQPTASVLRKRLTKAEASLWKYVLRAGRMKGYTFNRQRPVLRYIADFMCKPLHLIIEVDGSSHENPKVERHDAFRQRELEACGFTVLRFTNDEVLRGIESVRRAILLKVEEIESSIVS